MTTRLHSRVILFRINQCPRSVQLAVGWQVRNWLPTAVSQGPDPVLDDREQAIAWLEDLVQRLWKSMP